MRAAKQLGILDDYISAGFGFDAVEVFLPERRKVANMPSPRLVEGCPANVGIGSARAACKVLGTRAKGAGADVRLGVTAETWRTTAMASMCGSRTAQRAATTWSSAPTACNSKTRWQIFPDAAKPRVHRTGRVALQLPEAAGDHLPAGLRRADRLRPRAAVRR